MAASEHVTLTRMKAPGNTAGVSSPGSEWVLVWTREERTKHACAIWDVFPGVGCVRQLLSDFHFSAQNSESKILNFNHTFQVVKMGY